MNKIETKRMIDLYNLMINFPEKAKFKIDFWASNLGPGKKIVCGTAVCAGGAGVLFLPSWKKAGIKFNKANYPAYNGQTASRALVKLLGISEKETMYIFMSKHYEPDVKEKDVAQHIAEVLENHGVKLEWDYE